MCHFLTQTLRELRLKGPEWAHSEMTSQCIVKETRILTTKIQCRCNALKKKKSIENRSNFLVCSFVRNNFQLLIGGLILSVAWVGDKVSLSKPSRHYRSEPWHWPVSSGLLRLVRCENTRSNQEHRARGNMCWSYLRESRVKFCHQALSLTKKYQRHHKHKLVNCKTKQQGWRGMAT